MLAYYVEHATEILPDFMYLMKQIKRILLLGTVSFLNSRIKKNFVGIKLKLEPSLWANVHEPAVHGVKSMSDNTICDTHP